MDAMVAWSSTEFTSDRKTALFQTLGCHGFGFWRRECKCESCAVFARVPFGELPREEDPYVLPLEGYIMTQELQVAWQSVPKSWAEYYELRGFKNDSPLSMVLEWPLTLFHILTNPAFCSPVSSAESTPTQLLVDIIGVEKEVDLMETFGELSKFLPRTNIRIRMIGNRISSRLHRHVERIADRLTVEIHRGVYHDLVSEFAENAHLAVAFNAGIVVFSEWKETLRELAVRRIPFVATDYCRLACLRAMQCVSGCDDLAQLMRLSEPVVNPFRNPLRIDLREYIGDHHEFHRCADACVSLTDDMDSAAFSNHFIQRAVYEFTANFSSST